MKTLENLMSVQSMTQVCREHGDYTSIFTRGKWSGCPVCMQEQLRSESLSTQAAAASQLQSTKPKALIEKLRLAASIPRRFQSRRLETYVAEGKGQQRALAICTKYLLQFDERLTQGGGLVLLGKPGNGKTHLACGIGNALVEQGRSVLFMDVYDLIDGVKERAFDRKECSEREAIQGFASVDLLILDEVGAQLGSEWERLTLFKVINERYKACLPTLIISNLDREKFKTYVGERIDDRMQEGGGAFITFDWDSYRASVRSVAV